MRSNCRNVHSSFEQSKEVDLGTARLGVGRRSLPALSFSSSQVEAAQLLPLCRHKAGARARAREAPSRATARLLTSAQRPRGGRPDFPARAGREDRKDGLSEASLGGPAAARGGRAAEGAPPPPPRPRHSPPQRRGIREPGGAAKPLSRSASPAPRPCSVAVGSARAAGPGHPGQQASRHKFKMEVDINGESRSILATLPLPIAEVGASGKVDSEKPRCSSTPCSPMRQTVSGYQILHMDSNYLVGFTTGEELLKLAQKCTVGEENKVEVVPTLRSKQLDSGLSRSSRVCKARSRYYQPYEIPAINGRRRRRMPSSGDKCTKPLPYEPYKAFHGPLPLCLFKGKRAHSKSLDYLNLDRMNIKEPADTEVLQYQLQHLTLRGDRMFARNNT